MAFHIINDNQSAPSIIATAVGIANAAGTGSGASVTTAVSFTDLYGNGKLPSNLAYVVHVEPNQPAYVTITGKTASGFNVILTPPAGTTLSAGTFNVAVLA